MSQRGSLRGMLGALLALGAGAGCDVGTTHIFDQAGPSAAGTPASGGNSNGGGSGGSGGTSIAPGGPCRSAADCNDQVCSPTGTCVDCNEDKDCLEKQYCDQSRCVATGGDTGGSSSGGSGGSGAGGSAGSGSCGGAQVLFVVQRSGIMFEQPDPEENYWAMVKDAALGDEGSLRDYFEKLPVGALLFVRVQDQDTCPVVSSKPPALAASAPLGELFAEGLADYRELADADAKLDAPVGEAVAAAASLLSGPARHLVLITTGVADTCDDTDNPCLMDPAIAAVQAARQAGVTTHVIGMGNTDLLDTSADQDGYDTYLKQLANAGGGKSVKKSSAFDEKCSDDDAKATYGDSDGDAKAYRAESAGDVKSALAEIFRQICP